MRVVLELGRISGRCVRPPQELCLRSKIGHRKIGIVGHRDISIVGHRKERTVVYKNISTV